jgi:hypothetical protein
MSGRPRNELDLRPHGTPAAYRRHYRRGEKPCEACRQAESRRHADNPQRAAYEAVRNERYRAAREAGLSPREAMTARDSPAYLQRVLAGVS